MLIVEDGRPDSQNTEVGLDATHLYTLGARYALDQRGNPSARSRSLTSILLDQPPRIPIIVIRKPSRRHCDTHKAPVNMSFVCHLNRTLHSGCTSVGQMTFEYNFWMDRVVGIWFSRHDGYVNLESVICFRKVRILKDGCIWLCIFRLKRVKNGLGNN